jgi:hypothetical protein
MSRAQFATAPVEETGADGLIEPQTLPGAAVAQRRLQDALAELGPGRPLPPPPKPSRASPELDTDEELTADEIVQTLAEVAQPEPQPEVKADAPIDDELERPPMMIEKALAARLSGVYPAAVPNPSIWPGLTAGLLLSIAAGCGLFYFLTLA